jgi:hypothetical protein
VFLKCVRNYERHFSFFYPDYRTSGLTVTGLARVYSTKTLKYYDKSDLFYDILTVNINSTCRWHTFARNMFSSAEYSEGYLSENVLKTYQLTAFGLLALVTFYPED